MSFAIDSAGLAGPVHALTPNTTVESLALALRNGRPTLFQTLRVGSGTSSASLRELNDGGEVIAESPVALCATYAPEQAFAVGATTLAFFSSCGSLHQLSDGAPTTSYIALPEWSNYQFRARALLMRSGAVIAWTDDAALERTAWITRLRDDGTRMRPDTLVVRESSQSRQEWVSNLTYSGSNPPDNEVEIELYRPAWTYDYASYELQSDEVVRFASERTEPRRIYQSLATAGVSHTVTHNDDMSYTFGTVGCSATGAVAHAGCAGNECAFACAIPGQAFATIHSFPRPQDSATLFGPHIAGPQSPDAVRVLHDGRTFVVAVEDAGFIDLYALNVDRSLTPYGDGSAIQGRALAAAFDGNVGLLFVRRSNATEIVYLEQGAVLPFRTLLTNDPVVSVIPLTRENGDTTIVYRAVRSTDAYRERLRVRTHSTGPVPPRILDAGVDARPLFDAAPSNDVSVDGRESDAAAPDNALEMSADASLDAGTNRDADVARDATRTDSAADAGGIPPAPSSVGCGCDIGARPHPYGAAAMLLALLCFRFSTRKHRGLH